MKVVVTGSCGLVGSEAARFFLELGCDVTGIDCDMRKHFFGEEASVSNNMIVHPKYFHIDIDICNSMWVFRDFKPDVIIHCAAQPSHDWAAKDPMLDFQINAQGTLILLEACRQYCPDAVFIYTSTNKVYGDRPNLLPLVEQETRYESIPYHGIDESMSVDNCLHSLFGVSKLSGDLLAQEYGRYFGIKTGIFRCGCITGSHHAGAELHGFLSYMAKCKKENKLYKIYGYKGKQVRDNIHAYDLVNAFYHFTLNPRPGEVYNMGGGRHSNISVLEALEIMGVKSEYIDQPRKGDHIWYISDVSKFKRDYPGWSYKYDMGAIIAGILYEPNEYAQQRQREKKRWIYPVLMAMEAEWHRKQGHEVDWIDSKWGYDKVIMSAEGLPFLSLPHPDRIFTRAFDPRYQQNGNFKYRPGTYIQVANGCWHGRCTFCVENKNKWEVRPVDDVIDEIYECKALGFKEIFDDSGTFPVRDWLYKFCSRLRNIGGLRFSCNMRMVDVDYRRMRDCGFRMVLFGVESANQFTLDKINKGVKCEDIKFIKKAAKAGLEPHIAVMFGYPWETDEEAVNTLHLVHYLLRKGFAKTAQASFYSPHDGKPGEESHRKYVSSIYRAAYYPDFWINKLKDIHNTADLKYLWRQIKEGINNVS